MSPALAVFLVFAGLVVAYGIADWYGRRKTREASDSLRQRTRVGL